MEENKTEKKRRGKKEEKNCGGEENGKGKGRKFLTENILFFVGKETEENIWRRTNYLFEGEGKGGNYLEKEKQIGGEKTEKEKEENVWRRKIFFAEEKEKEKLIGQDK